MDTDISNWVTHSVHLRKTHCGPITYSIYPAKKSSLPPTNDPLLPPDSFLFQETGGSEPEHCSRCRYDQDRAWCGSTTTQLHILQVMSGAIILRICCHSRKPQDTLPYNFFFALVALTIFGPVKLWTFLDDSQRVSPPKSYIYGQHDVRACGCLCMPTQPWRAVHAPGQAKLNKYSCLYMSTRQLHCVVI